MNSTHDLQLLSAYMDDELSEPERLALERRMEQDTAMRERLYGMHRMRRAVKTTAQRYATPPRLRLRIQASARPRGSAPWHRIVLEGRRLFAAQAIAWRSLGVALSVGAFALSVINITVWQPARDERLMQAAVTSHLRAANARPLVDVASADRDTVQPWLAERLGFVAPAALPSVAEVTLVGARLDGLDGHLVAAVVYRFLARWLTHNDHDAEDVVQEAMMRAMRYMGSCRGDDAKAWLLQIVRNSCFTWLKENRPAERLFLDDDGEAFNEIAAPAPDEPDALAARNADRRQINDAIASLPAAYRDVLVLREIEDLSYSEIAQIAHIPVGTVMSRLARARGLLRKMLSFAEPELRVVAGGSARGAT